MGYGPIGVDLANEEISESIATLYLCMKSLFEKTYFATRAFHRNPERFYVGTRACRYQQKLDNHSCSVVPMKCPDTVEERRDNLVRGSLDSQRGGYRHFPYSFT